MRVFKGGMEGKPEEISNFIENNGLRVQDFLEFRKEALRVRWVIIPVGSSLFLMSLILIPLYGILWHSILFILAFGSVVWTISSVQLRWGMVSVSTVVALGLLLMLMVASGVLPIKEALERGFAIIPQVK